MIDIRKTTDTKNKEFAVYEQMKTHRMHGVFFYVFSYNNIGLKHIMEA
ncbi:hypothetical protein JCM19376_27510 [Fusibacter bizertensis]